MDPSKAIVIDIKEGHCSVLGLWRFFTLAFWRSMNNWIRSMQFLRSRVTAPLVSVNHLQWKNCEASLRSFLSCFIQQSRRSAGQNPFRKVQTFLSKNRVLVCRCCFRLLDLEDSSTCTSNLEIWDKFARGSASFCFRCVTDELTACGAWLKQRRFQHLFVRVVMHAPSKKLPRSPANYELSLTGRIAFATSFNISLLKLMLCSNIWKARRILNCFAAVDGRRRRPRKTCTNNLYNFIDTSVRGVGFSFGMSLAVLVSPSSSWVRISAERCDSSTCRCLCQWGDLANTCGGIPTCPQYVADDITSFGRQYGDRGQLCHNHIWQIRQNIPDVFHVCCEWSMEIMPGGEQCCRRQSTGRISDKRC